MWAPATHVMETRVEFLVPGPLLAVVIWGVTHQMEDLCHCPSTIWINKCLFFKSYDLRVLAFAWFCSLVFSEDMLFYSIFRGQTTGLFC